MSIQVRNLTKTFGNFRALDNVSLEVPHGELVALLGPSGSGKTTLLRLIAGLEQTDTQPDGKPSGQIFFASQDVADRHVRERQVGFVFQHYALFRHMSVFENVAFGLRVKPRNLRPGNEVIRGKVMELLRLVQLEGLEKRYPQQLSGGQRQRVALARALAVEPKVLLLDEPFGALDAKVRLELRRWLRRLHDEIHVTSLFVTHDQEEALEVADKVVVMNRGKIEQIGSPDQVFHHPANEFVVNFLGNVNLFHGRNAEGKPARVFVRPFDLELSQARSDENDFEARVLRVQSAGSLVKVELQTDEGRQVQAELPHERYRELGLTVGQTVYARPRQTRMFAEDYAI